MVTIAKHGSFTQKDLLDETHDNNMSEETGDDLIGLQNVLVYRQSNHFDK